MRELSLRESVGWQLTATRERYPVTKIAALFVVFESPEVAKKSFQELSRSGPSLHEIEKGLVRVAGVG